VPLHVPRIAAPLMRLVVRKEHVQQCDHAMGSRAAEAERSRVEAAPYRLSRVPGRDHCAWDAQ